MSPTSLVLLSVILAAGIVTGLEVRLAGNGTYRSGRVEIRRSSSEAWGTVCDDLWRNNAYGKRNADVVCRMLGFLSAEHAVIRAGFGQGYGTVYLNNVRCRGTESNLLNCSTRGWASATSRLCGHHKDVGVVCQANYIQDIRLVGGNNRSGRVEVRRRNSESWRTLCDNYWERSEADVVCRLLGFRYSQMIKHNGSAISLGFGQGSGAIYPENFKCYGYEPSLDNCSSSLNTRSCSHNEHIGVECAGFEVRLANGTDRSGRVEIRTSDKEAWGTVCNDFWDVRYHGRQNANVLCRMLGFPSAESSVMTLQFGPGSGPIYMDNVRCNGTESDLIECPATLRWVGAVHDCDHNEDVGVVCQAASETTTLQSVTNQTQPQTVPGSPQSDGRDIIYDECRSCPCETGATSTWGPSYPGSVAVPMNRTRNDAEIKLLVNHETVKFRQTFGHHRMTLMGGDSEFVVQINVYDPAVERKLRFRADYSVSCDLLEDNLTNHIIEIQVLTGAIHINEICDGDCNHRGEPQLSCVGDTLTIDWLTDLTYSAEVTQLPSEISDKLTENIRQRGSVLNLAVHSDDHEIVSPTVNSDGLSLTPILRSSCREENMTYDALSDRCIDD